MDPGKSAEEISWSCWLRTMLAGSGAMLLLVYNGMNEAQSSVLLPQLKKADSFIRVTPDEETWLAYNACGRVNFYGSDPNVIYLPQNVSKAKISNLKAQMTSLGLIMTAVTTFFIGPFIDAFGRKKGLQFFYLITSLGYAVMTCAREVYQIYVGRAFCGIGAGLFACAVVYMVEICTKTQREYFLSLTSALIASGMTLMSVISGYFPWHVASLIFSVAAFILFIVQFFIPESPAWLCKMGKEDNAIRSFKVLGRGESEIQRELDTLKLQCKNDKQKIEWRTFLEPTVWKPFVIMLIFFFLQNWSGIVIIFFYSVDFIEKLGTTHDPLDVAVMVSTTRLLISCTLCIFFRSKVGRKFAVAFSGFGMTVTYTGLGAYEYVYCDVNVSERPFQWLTVAALILYVSFSVLGLLGLPWVMSGEVYPLKMRGTMTGVTHVVAWGFMFLVVKTYNMSIEALQIYNLVFVYAGFSLAAGFFAISVLPETQNKSLFDIEQSFLPEKRKQLKTDTPQTTKM